MIERLDQPPVPPRQLNPAVTPQLEEVLMKALAPEPVDRFGEMQELVKALDGLRRADSRDTRRTTKVILRDQVPLGPHLSIVGTGVLLTLSPDRENLIGRSIHDSDLVPDIDLSAHGGGQAGVSRLHARLVHREGQWYLEDLNSTNGTSVNGQALAPGQPIALNDGDMILFGSMNVTFYSSEHAYGKPND
jgi:pSer/pThr/pTyr-binding forkhead associated (FHA) protein